MIAKNKMKERKQADRKEPVDPYMYLNSGHTAVRTCHTELSKTYKEEIGMWGCYAGSH